MKRCPRCKTIFVCWNWIHSNLDEAVKLNPHMTYKQLKESQWIHECHVCGHTFETEKKVTNGIPYKLLRLYGFVKYNILRRND